MKVEFSKLVLGSVMGLYFAGAIFGGIVVWQEHTMLAEYLTYIGAPTATAIGFYAWKARAENVIKINAACKDKEVLRAAINADAESEGLYGVEADSGADMWGDSVGDSGYLPTDEPAAEGRRMAVIRRVRSGEGSRRKDGTAEAENSI